MFRTLFLVAIALLLVSFADVVSAISCYSRDSSTIKSNGSIANCPSDTACYRYTSKTVSYGGCGTCTADFTKDYNCESCTTDYCNTWPELVGCFYAKGDYVVNDWMKISCSKSSCYFFSYGYAGSTFFFAGCGDCADYSKFETCKTCSTDYCNAASHIAAGKLAAAQMAAGSLIVLMLLSRVF